MKRLKRFTSVSVLSLIIFFLSGCGGNINLLQNSPDDDLIRYMATAYNKGIEMNLDELKELADSVSYNYDDEVLKYYKYFTGEIPLENLEVEGVFSTRATDTYDSRIRNYILSVVQNFSNNSASITIVDQYDEKIPVAPTKDLEQAKYAEYNPTLLTSYEKRNLLIDKVYNLIKKDYDSFALFRKWFEEFYQGETLSDEDIRIFSEFLVDVAYTYTNSGISLTRLHDTTSDSYPKIVQLNHIPVELLLAIAYQESRFFPGSYRAEILNENIYALSFGLTHILIDSDCIDISLTNNDIGDGINDRYTFEQISYYYLGNSLNDETYFSDKDLLMIRGAFLYSVIYLDMIYQKLYQYFGVENQ